MNRAFASALAAALALAGAACDTSKARPIEPTAEVAACERCHGYPPQPGSFIAGGTQHTTSEQCSACHPGTVEGDNLTIIPGGLHMNGVVDASGSHAMPYLAQHASAALADVASCTACHGNDYGGGDAGQPSCNGCHVAVSGSGPDWKTNCTFCHGTRTTGVTTATAKAAPPKPVVAAADETRTNPSVGAHQAHLGQGTVSNAMACESCHAVPTGAQALGHFAGYDGSPAPVTFANSAFATKGAGAPTYTGGTCAVYCHGAGTEFGSPADQKSPAWTAAGVTCTTCHENPPTRGPTISGQNAHAFHGTAGATCARCHGTGYSTTAVDKAKHVNGTKDVAGNQAWDCSACHAALGVQIAHPLPFEQGHTSVALASIGSCTNCHGTNYGGGTAQSCTACHVARGLVGGAEWTTNCTFCHGTPTAGVTTATAKSAPPESVAGTGVQDRTNARIGAHQAHLVQGAFAGAMPCASCHTVPAGAQALSHFNNYDGTLADVTFANSAFATKGVTGATYAGGTCNVYCHGAGTEFSPAKTSPQWTSTVALTCTSCHGNPPSSHAPTSTNCNACHSGTVDTNNTTIKVAGGLHVNGTVEATSAHPTGWGDKAQHGYYVNANGLTSCKSCHGSPSLQGGSGRACSECHGTGWDTNCTFCHGTVGGSAAPPVDTQGRSVTTNVSVGVHTSHVTTTIATPLTCAQCHPARSTSVITDTTHIDGSANGADVSLGALARTGGAAATYNRASATSATCASVYCHGKFAGGANTGNGATMSWTSTTQASCTSCHGAPPSTGEHSKHSGGSFTCGECHGTGYSYNSTARTGTVNAPKHVNGAKDVPFSSSVTSPSTPPTFNGSCSLTCHGKNHSNEPW